MAEVLAIGFRAHTGWAATVTLAGPASAPRVIDRRRVELSAETELDRLHLYHTAAEQPYAKAEAMIEAAIAATNATAKTSINALIAAIHTEHGTKPARAGIVAGNQALPESLEAILASHALVHAAEGEMYRAAIDAACASAKLKTIRVAGKTLTDHAASTLGLAAGTLRDRLVALGAGLGAPWAQDQKEAALVAWLALTAR